MPVFRYAKVVQELRTFLVVYEDRRETERKEHEMVYLKKDAKEVSRILLNKPEECLMEDFRRMTLSENALFDAFKAIEMENR
jgi:hypothetical protein